MHGNAFAFALMSLVLLLAPAPRREPAAQDSEALWAQAEAHRAEGSHELARRLYAELATRELEAERARWVELRLADATWRSLAATEQHDPSERDAARETLEEIVARAERPEARDRIWAEAQESLGDYYAQTSWHRDVGSGLVHYRAAMEWWGGARDVELARERWLAMFRRLAHPRWAWEGWTPWSHGHVLPIDLLEDAREVAVEAEDRALVDYMHAVALARQAGGPNQSRAAERRFQAALGAGRESTVHDDALFAYAQWLEQWGRWVRRDDGTVVREPDAAKALELYQRILSEYREGESTYWHAAEERARAIVAPELSLWVESWFAPGSEARFVLGWRNLASVELSLWPVDLAADVRFRDPDDGAWEWMSAIDLVGREPARRWQHATGDRGDHREARTPIVLDPKLDRGAWLLVARSGALERREIVLVTDTALVVKAVGNRVLAWATGAQDGKPLAGAVVRAWARVHDGGGGRRWVEASGRTGDDGVALLEMPGGAGRHYDVYVAAKHERGQAFTTVGSSADTPDTGWRIYACTDRPAYRPGQLVQWKTIVRRFAGLAYETPAGEALAYAVVGPRGDEIARGELALDSFGAAWGALETDAKMALGPYQITFRREQGNRTIGSAELFRLEEYKLPEFEVRVTTPDDPQRPEEKRTYVVGDVVGAEIRAELYAGGGVPNASVEVVVTQRPWQRRWEPLVRHEWFARALRPEMSWNPRWHPGQEILRETLVTDAEGRVTVRFATPEGTQQDYEYEIEARATDASRRTVTGSGRVRVTQRSYFVDVSSPHRIWAPGRPVELRFAASDANESPLAVAGVAHLLRARWVEEWVGPAGEVIGAREVAERRARGAFHELEWTCRRAELVHEEVARSPLATGPDGKATWSPVPPEDGTYVARWVSEDPRGGEIVGEWMVYVCSERTRDVDRFTDAIDIVVDQESVAEGERTAVMLATEASGRHVLFTVEAGDLIEWRVVPMSGRVELLTLDVSERWVPNVFLTATFVANGTAEREEESVVVAPVRRFLDVTVTSDAPEHKPGEDGAIDVLVRDHAGAPVQAQLALSLYDESVAAIQEEQAGDLRTFFYGHPRSHDVSSSSSLDERRVETLTRDEKGRVVRLDEVDAGEPNEERLGRAARSRAGMPAPSTASRAEGRDAYESETKALGEMGYRGQSDAMAPMEELGATGGGEPVVVVRSDFRETALWAPDLVTGADGRAHATVRFPDSTTRWRAVVRAADAGTRVGWAQASPVRTSLPLVARLAAPRFFVVGDEVVLSAVFDNHTDAPLVVTPSLSVAGLVLLDAPEGASEASGSEIVVAPHGQGRADWRVAARAAGEATLTVTGIAGEHVDAMRRTLPVREHGIDVFLSDTGRLDAEELVHVFELPAARRAGSTRMVVRVAPSIAVTMLDALPYLVDYPYGCTEQTLSRFVPTIVSAKTLADLGLSRDAVLERAFGGIEEEHAARTHPKGKAAYEALDRVVADGLARLERSQLGDGGFGWWPEGEADAFMTAYCLWALVLARDAGTDVQDAMIERAAAWIDVHLADAEARLDLQAWMLHAIAEHWRSRGAAPSEHGRRAWENLWERRGELNAYARALLTLAAHRMGFADEARVLVRNLANGVVIDEEPGRSDIGGGAGGARARTAHWGDAGLVWRWSDGGVEATAFALRALLAVEPSSDLVPAVVQWLVQNRRGAQWKSTRDTAIVVLALCDYLTTTKEAARDVEYEVLVDGAQLARVRVKGSEALAAPSAFVVEAPRSGANEIRVRRLSGTGPLYWSVSASFFSEEEPIPARGGDLFLRRFAYRLVAHPTLLGGDAYERVPLAPGDEVKSGERVEIVLAIEAKQDLEYLVVEDLKPAGLEAVDVTSGRAVARELRADELDRRFGAGAGSGFEVRGDRESRPEAGTTGRQRTVWRELRETHVAAFFDRLPEGVWELRTMLRAEAPGTFHWLPAKGWAMYVPEIRANGAESAIRVLDR